MATKFVAWEVPTLEALKGSKVYNLREKLNNGGQMNREEKDWLTEKVNSNTYFKNAVPLQGWRFDFSDVLRTYLVHPGGRALLPVGKADGLLPSRPGGKRRVLCLNRYRTIAGKNRYRFLRSPGEPCCNFRWLQPNFPAGCRPVR